jgi:hypothetical protein
MPTATLTLAQESVEKGAALLDNFDPDWHYLIDLDTLDVGDVGNCILSQLFGGWQAGKTALDLYDGQHAAVYGFEQILVGDDYETTYEDLDAEWTALIILRRTA